MYWWLHEAFLQVLECMQNAYIPSLSTEFRNHPSWVGTWNAPDWKSCTLELNLLCSVNSSHTLWGRLSEQNFPNKFLLWWHFRASFFILSHLYNMHCKHIHIWGMVPPFPSLNDWLIEVCAFYFQAFSINGSLHLQLDPDSYSSQIFCYIPS